LEQNLFKKQTLIQGLGFEDFHDGVRCHTIVVSFHYSVGHFNAEEGHCQATLQQRQAQRPRQCIPNGVPGNPGQTLASDGFQDRHLTC